ncbi:MAG: tRNA (adenosine(37)-N6)-threonylcarbamoyltransferase complex transferase subunit TsaD [Gammaproteobacteria bacterium]|nr:MAG: tRNA (adenosine(37)-N6)-threonylcarbamoyltransferase complex transferase subunit TsaD [Gammaproteobacteria bacterium]
MNRTNTTLGIETSCDETAVALYDPARGLLAHLIHSQIATHAPYGGVVPELASRDHIRKLLPMVDGCLKAAGMTGPELAGVAYTAGPGLIGALLVGATVAVGLAAAWGVPAVPVHHMEAHLLAPLLEADRPAFPFVALLVSGGHTMLVEVAGLGRYRILGQTLDDAAGEAFDKTAKMLGLPYPGGPQLARLAGEGRPDRHAFPRPMLNRAGLDFSFSGLKTAVLLKARELSRDGQLEESDRVDLANSFQEAVVDTLVAKCARALEATGLERLVVAGGVGANRRLRQRLRDDLTARGAHVYYPRNEFCTDNGAMVALTGSLRLPGAAGPGGRVEARARWDLEDLRQP